MLRFRHVKVSTISLTLSVGVMNVYVWAELIKCLDEILIKYYDVTVSYENIRMSKILELYKITMLTKQAPVSITNYNTC